MNVEPKSETVETQINRFIEDKFNKTKKEVSMMTIQSKMSLVSMKDPEKWNEFKLGLRKAGYII